MSHNYELTATTFRAFDLDQTRTKSLSPYFLSPTIAGMNKMGPSGRSTFVSAWRQVLEYGNRRRGFVAMRTGRSGGWNVSQRVFRRPNL
jgi:hypothetical protein